MGGDSIKRWLAMIRKLQLTDFLAEGDDLLAAIRDGRDEDAMAACQRKAVDAQTELARFVAQNPREGRVYQRLRRYDFWMDAARDGGAMPNEPQPASLSELREAAWYRDEYKKREQWVNGFQIGAKGPAEFFKDREPVLED